MAKYRTTPSAVQRQVPGPSPEDEARRRSALVKHKLFVTSLLVLAAAIFLSCTWWQHEAGDAVPVWVGYVRAAAEAGMVGGLADWFAVTALFRHPMGIPIPHTALIPRKKDQLGDSLSGFVGENFLNAELITEKIAAAELPLKAGQWLAEADNARRVSYEAGKLAAKVVGGIDPAEAEGVIRRVVVDKLGEASWAPPLGRALEQLIEDGKTEPLIDAAVRWGRERIVESEDLIIRLLDERKPLWAPRFLNQLAGEKIYRELVKWIIDVDRNPDHEARHALRRFTRKLAEDLQHDPSMIQRVEYWKKDILGSRPVAHAPAVLWKAGSTSLIDASVDPSSPLRKKIVDLCQRWGMRLCEEPKLRESVNKRIVKAAAFLADNYADQITGIISETVHAWDSAEASEKIELMVGKDLQFIRLNGTIVGALAGLAIYTVSHLIFG